jgi:uncharacterized membrane protein YfcA
MGLGFGELAWGSVLLLVLAAFFAGLVDAVAGGGGLIQIPVLFAIFPSVPAAILLGTNKFSGVFGTSLAALRFARSTRMEWNAALPAAVAALVFAFAGAWSVTRVSPNLIRQILPFLLVVMGFYIVLKDRLGTFHAPLHHGRSEAMRGVALGTLIGFYDGFFGPGTGSFLLFMFVRIFGFDFLSASAAAKIVNVACNLAALSWFALSGNVGWECGLMMAVANLLGAFVGTRLALRHGNRLVRQMFLVVVAALVVKTTYDNFIR